MVNQFAAVRTVFIDDGEGGRVDDVLHARHSHTALVKVVLPAPILPYMAKTVLSPMAAMNSRQPRGCGLKSLF